MALELPHVEPGDLITADAFNTLARAIEELHADVDALLEESGTLIIHEVVGDLTVSKQIELRGHNFGVPANQNTVRLDTTPVEGFGEGSTSKVLKLTIPPVPGTLPRKLTLSVASGDLSDSVEVTIKPAGATVQGKPLLSNATTGTGTVTVGARLTYLFNVTTVQMLGADDFIVKPVYSSLVGTDEGATEQGWLSRTTVIGLVGDRVHLTSGVQASIGVQVEVPRGAKSATMALKAVSVSNDPASSALSDSVPIAVDKPQVTNSPFIVPRLQAFGPLSPIKVAQEGADTVLRVPVGDGDRVGVAVLFHVAGTFDYALELEGATTLWQVDQLSEPSSVQTADSSEDLSFNVTRRNQPAAASDRATLMLTATRRDPEPSGRLKSSLLLVLRGL